MQRLAREPLRGPRNLRARARPGPRARGREHPLDERPVEPRVVRHDEARALDERARRLDVNPLPADVVVREARQVRDFGRERAAGIVAVRLRLVVEDLDDGSSEGVRERQQRELDDRIVLRTETRRLAVDVEPPPKLRGPRIRESGGEHKRMQGAGFARVA